jgi:hypothetical protein
MSGSPFYFLLPMPLLRALIFAAPVKKELASGFPKAYDALPLLHVKNE